MSRRIRLNKISSRGSLGKMSLIPSPVKGYVRLNNLSIKPTKTREIVSYDPEGKVIMLEAGDESTNELQLEDKFGKMSLKASPVKGYIRLNNRSIKITKMRREIISYDPDGKVLMLGAGDESTNGLPFGLYKRIKKAIDLLKHLETHKNDEKAMLELEVVEGDILRTAHHYKLANLLPSGWKYDRATASALVSKE